MVEVKRGDIYYYIYNFKPKELVWAKLEVKRDGESDHGLSLSFYILKSNKLRTSLENTNAISANQLHGVGVWGFNPFISKDNRINIKRIFEGNKV